MPAQLSQHLRATLAAHVAHGIDAIDARAIVRACGCEPDANAALEAIRTEFASAFTQSGLECFERAFRGAPVEEGAAGQVQALQSDLRLWRAELEREHERKRHAFMLGAVFGFPAVSAAAVVMGLEDEQRLSSLDEDGSSVQRLALAAMRAEQLVRASKEATHRLMQLLASRQPEPEATTWLSSFAAGASAGLRAELRARGEALVGELSRRAHPQREAQADALFAKVMLRLAALVQGN